MAAPAAATISVWRIAKHTREYAATDLSGGGAKTTGGRWNSKGMPVVYASTSVALATLETLAHLGDNIAIRNAFLVRIDIPERVWKRRELIRADDFDPTWAAEPPGSTTVKFGNDWLRSRDCAILMVPSVIVPEEYNVLINPEHGDAARIGAKVVRQYVYDPRL